MELERQPRRTQAERRESTRSALLEATIASLVEVGYARTTTTEVVRRAGVSQGALFKHFPTKSALVAASAEQLFADLVGVFEHAFAASADTAGEAPLVIAMRRLWDVFCMKELSAVYRLYAEAPADPELLAALIPVVKQHDDNLTRLAFDLFPELGKSEVYVGLFSAAIFAMQGASMQRLIYVDATHEQSMLAQFEMLARALAPAAGTPALKR
jgi:AcrR family transcriptional regulator